MALWKDQSTPARKDAPPATAAGDPLASPFPHDMSTTTPAPLSTPRPTSASPESVIGSDLSIEGTISGNGSVRLAGRFTGDVTVDGAVNIEHGARLAGGIRATSVTIAGELEGNVLQASHVEILPSGALTGDITADTLTLAAGSRVRGHIDCGWGDTPAKGASGSNRLKDLSAGRSSTADAAPDPSRNGVAGASAS